MLVSSVSRSCEMSGAIGPSAREFEPTIATDAVSDQTSGLLCTGVLLVDVIDEFNSHKKAHRG